MATNTHTNTHEHILVSLHILLTGSQTIAIGSRHRQSCPIPRTVRIVRHCRHPDVIEIHQVRRTDRIASAATTQHPELLHRGRSGGQQRHEGMSAATWNPVWSQQRPVASVHAAPDITKIVAVRGGIGVAASVGAAVALLGVERGGQATHLHRNRYRSGNAPIRGQSTRKHQVHTDMAIQHKMSNENSIQRTISTLVILE